MKDILRDKNSPDDVIVRSGDFVINEDSIAQHYYDILSKDRGTFNLNKNIGLNVSKNYIDAEGEDLFHDFIEQCKFDNLPLQLEHLKNFPISSGQ